MNIKRGLRRLNFIFLGLVLVFSILVAGNDPAQIGYNIGMFLIFAVVWTLVGWLVAWMIKGFSDE